MTMQEQLEELYKRICIIGDHLEGDRINSACLDVGVLTQKIETLKNSFSCGDEINRRKEIIERLKKLEGFLNG